MTNERFNEKLAEYARLTATMGVNVKPGQYVLLRCAVEAADFGRMVMEECFKLGARDVIFLLEDQRAARIRYDNAALEEFQTLPAWKAEQRNFYAREGCVCINIVAEDPEVFAGAPSEKLTAATLAADRSFKEFYDIMLSGGMRWTIVAYPCAAWAKKVFPNLSESRAVAKLWEAIFKTVRITRGDTVKKWQRHDRLLKRRARKLNSYAFDSLHYRNSLGTDLVIGLAKGHIWMGGSDKSTDGVKYFANMPTEEIFTMPDCRRAEGRVYSALPLSYQGELIDRFWLEFKDGRVVDCGAEVGEHALLRLLDTDEGSCSLGEAALIPHSSPISELGLLFYNTLFDENASCHLALGSCYPDTIKGGVKLSEDTLYERGGNRSANHVDFMIGTADMEITGILPDGSEVPVFKDGEFVF